MCNSLINLALQISNQILEINYEKMMCNLFNYKTLYGKLIEQKQKTITKTEQ